MEKVVGEASEWEGDGMGIERNSVEYRMGRESAYIIYRAMKDGAVEDDVLSQLHVLNPFKPGTDYCRGFGAEWQSQHNLGDTNVSVPEQGELK